MLVSWAVASGACDAFIENRLCILYVCDAHISPTASRFDARLMGSSTSSVRRRACGRICDAFIESFMYVFVVRIFGFLPASQFDARLICRGVVMRQTAWTRKRRCPTPCKEDSKEGGSGEALAHEHQVGQRPVGASWVHNEVTIDVGGDRHASSCPWVDPCYG